jgi:hypothetical protein
MRNYVLPRIVTIIGVFFVVAGVARGFVDEGTHFRFDFLHDYAGLFLTALPVGICLSAGGIVAWSRHLDRGERLRLAGFIFALGLVAAFVTPNNVHGPGMLLGLSAVCALILSFVVMLTAVIGKETSER